MKKYLVWLGELLIWLVVLSILVGAVSLLHTINSRHKHSYHVFFEDIDGMIKGSSVRFSGMDVGYVTDIRMVDENIFVSFLVTKKGLKIPKNSVATVESTGMAGSKSLEIYPPKKHSPNITNLIITREPIRFQDAMNNQNSIAATLLVMCHSLSSMFIEPDVTKYRNVVKKIIDLSVYEEKIEQIENVEDNLIDKIKKRGVVYE